MIKSKRGITLIALVVTIIVLLLLAGVSISMLTGQNGILNRAGEAKEKTDIAQKEELAKLEGLEAVTNVSGYVDSKTGVKIPAGYTVSQVDGENSLDDGLVIKDVDGNEFVWIEVPQTLYNDTNYNQDTTVNPAVDKKPRSDTDYENIEFCLRKYAAPYTEGKKDQGCDWKDEWYDRYNATWNGSSEYAYIANQNSYRNWKEYYGENNIYKSTSNSVTGTMTQVNLTTESYSTSSYYFVKVNEQFKNHTDGCGMTYQEYNQAKKKMLTSIYTNGGFWISRYEIGDEEGTKKETPTMSTGSSNPLTKGVSKANQIPYVLVSCSQAETLAKKLAQNSMTTSSLPFGVQWDLVCKYLEVKLGDNATVESKNIINQDSTSWGNYSNSEITLNRGKYVKWQYGYFSDSRKWYEYKETVQDLVENGQKKKYGGGGEKGIILTTGASDQAKKMNIYDLAGNVTEFTMERATSSASCPCALRGGRHYQFGYVGPASSGNDDCEPGGRGCSDRFACRTLLVATTVLIDVTKT